MTTYFFDENNNVSSQETAIFALHIFEKDKTPETRWKRLAAQIRQANSGPQGMNNFKTCFGILNKSFFSVEDMEDTDALMVLELKRPNPRTNKSEFTFCGFVMIDFKNSIGHDDDSDSDEEMDEDSDEDSEEDSDEEMEDNFEDSPNSRVLYINAICANANHVKERLGGKRLRIGKLLMQQCEWFARRNRFSVIELSALAYVINYYRQFGFKHIKDCSEEEDKKIQELSKNYQRVRVSKDEELIQAFIVEAAKKYKILGNEDEKRTWLMTNLNEYFKADDISFRVEGDHIVAYNEDGEENVKITELVAKDQSYIYHYLEELRFKRFAVACQEKEQQRRNKRATRDEDGDISVIDCDDEGYTMVKCLTKRENPPPPITTDPDYDGTGEKKMIGGKLRNRHTRKKSKKGGPAKGWAKKAPHGKERTVMLKKCGKKCFLGPKKSFPICNKGTCKVNSKGIYAAYMRAEEWGNARKTYKTSKPKHARKTYKKIASKAKKMLRRRGYKNVGKHSRKNKHN